MGRFMYSTSVIYVAGRYPLRLRLKGKQDRTLSIDLKKKTTYSWDRELAFPEKLLKG